MWDRTDAQEISRFEAMKCMHSKSLMTAVSMAVAALLMVTAGAEPIAITNNPGYYAFGKTVTNNVENNVTTIDNDRSGYTISNFSLNGGNAVVLCFAAEGASTTQLSATYGGEQMTVVQTVDGDRWQGAIAYIINPAAATGDIVASWVDVCGSILQPLALSNVAALAGSNSSDSSPSVTLDYTTAEDGGFVIGAGVNNGSSGPSPQTTGLSTDLVRKIVENNFSVTFAYTEDVGTAGSYQATVGGNPGADSSAIVAFDAVGDPPVAVDPEVASISVTGNAVELQIAGDDATGYYCASSTDLSAFTTEETVYSDPALTNALSSPFNTSGGNLTLYVDGAGRPALFLRIQTTDPQP